MKIDNVIKFENFKKLQKKMNWSRFNIKKKRFLFENIDKIFFLVNLRNLFMLINSKVFLFKEENFFQFIRYKEYQTLFNYFKFFFIKKKKCLIRLMDSKFLCFKFGLNKKKNNFKKMLKKIFSFFSEVKNTTKKVLIKKKFNLYLFSKEKNKNFFEEKLNLIFPKKEKEKKFQNSPRTKKENSLTGDNFENNIRAELTKITTNSFFKSKLNEFFQLKGYFDLKKHRIKNFVNLWDETVWIGKILKIKKRNDIFDFVEEIYVLILFLQTNSCDFCSNCLKEKNFLRYMFKFKYGENFFWKIFYLNRIWSKFFSKKTKKKKIFQRFSLNSDQGFNICMFAEKTNSNFEFYDLKLCYFPFERFSFISNSKIHLNSDDFLYDEMENYFTKNKLKILTNKSLFSFSKNLIWKKCHKKSHISFDSRFFWSKSFDSRPFSFKKIIQNFFEMNKKKNGNLKIGWLFYHLFFKTFSGYPKIKKNPSPGKRKKNFFSNFQIWNISLTKQSHLEVQNLQKFFNLESFFFKRKFFLLSKKFFKISFGLSFFLAKNFFFLGAYFSLTNFFFLVYRKLVTKEFKEYSKQKIILQFFSLYSTDYLKTNFLKISDSFNFQNVFCVIDCKQNLNQNHSDINQNNFSIGVFTLLKERISFSINSNLKYFSKIILIFCAKFRIKKIFIINDSLEKNKYSKLLKIFLTKKIELFETKMNKNSKNFPQLKFIKKVQIIELKKNSIITILSNSLFFKSISSSQIDCILNAINIYERIGLLGYGLILTGRKNEIKTNSYFENKYLSDKNLKKIFFFCFKKLFFNFFIDERNFSQLKIFQPFLKFVCGFGARNSQFILENLSKHLTEKKNSKENRIIKPIEIGFSNEKNPKKLNSKIFFKNSFEKKPDEFFLQFWLKKIENHKINVSENFVLFNNKKILENFIQSERKIMVKSWKSIILKTHQIGQILNIQPKRNKGYFIGKMSSGFEFFSEKNNLFKKNLKFSRLIRIYFQNFLVKIISIYPKILKVRVSLLPNGTNFFPFLKMEKIKMAKNWNLERKINQSKYFGKKKNLKGLSDLKIFENKKWYFEKKLGDFFIWNIKDFSFLISFILNKETLFCASYFIKCFVDVKTQKFVYGFQGKIFFDIEKMIKKIKKNLQKFLFLALDHKDFFKKSQNELNNFLIDQFFIEKTPKKFLFKFFVSTEKQGYFSLFFGNGLNHFKSKFQLTFYGYKFGQKNFSSINSLKKYLTTEFFKKIDNF
ncbi:hypothetical protein HAN_3g432 (nucleomorph) [Hemiselmis andersenii]|uniref:Uncharacterized protein n=3 Tax=Hemiselmis andersenii TaxID=464988 RepID=A9BL54_HEMAN|nr:hypothetical protein HAN_3g432 [Hemiselmis andersenii]ABW98237.1 hypothetical protein HAN_3g432 [Hemiselmis andersenii]